jgi:PAS domain S-box-containing protein
MISFAMGVMVVLFLLFISASAARVGESFNETIQLRIEAVNREKVLKQNEKRLNQAQQIAHLGSSVFIPETSQLQWSDEHFRLWGIEPQSVTPSYALFRDGIHPDDVARVEMIIADAMQSGGMYDCEHRIVRPDGSIRYVRSCGEATLGDTGKVIQMTGTVQDITARKEAESLQEDVNEKHPDNRRDQ